MKMKLSPKVIESELCITENHIIYFCIALHSTKHFLINIIPVDSPFTRLRYRRHGILLSRFLLMRENNTQEEFKTDLLKSLSKVNRAQIRLSAKYSLPEGCRCCVSPCGLLASAICIAPCNDLRCV